MTGALGDAFEKKEPRALLDAARDLARRAGPGGYEEHHLTTTAGRLLAGLGAPGIDELRRAVEDGDEPAIKIVGATGAAELIPVLEKRLARARERSVERELIEEALGRLRHEQRAKASPR